MLLPRVCRTRGRSEGSLPPPSASESSGWLLNPESRDSPPLTRSSWVPGAPGAGDESGAELGLDLAQQLTGDAGEGFTYELRPELAGKHKLGDFVT